MEYAKTAGAASPLTPHGLRQAAMNPVQQGAGAIQAPPPATVLDAILHRLMGMLHTQDRIEQALNRAIGYMPEPADTCAAPPPGAMLDQIGEAMIRLSDRLHVAADRLDRIA